MNLSTKSNKPLFPIGVGTWTIGGLRSAEREEDAKAIQAIRYSLKKGQNHIDTAEMYGAFHTDEVVGQAIAESKRDDLFIADKLWQTSVAKGQVRPTVEKMLLKLGTDYIDLLYIHYPWDNVPWREAIPQVDELIEEGVVRHFGVSNFTVGQMREASGIAKHPIAATQMNFNVLHQTEVNEEYRAFCRDHDIQIVAYQPIKRREVLNDPDVIEVAKRVGGTPSQVALAWLIKLGALPIPKATETAHIDENVGAMEIELSDEDMARLA
jgi:diketogulonate reductase-like aldo/keto reductase